MEYFNAVSPDMHICPSNMMIEEVTPVDHVKSIKLHLYYVMMCDAVIPILGVISTGGVAITNELCG